MEVIFNSKDAYSHNHTLNKQTELQELLSLKERGLSASSMLSVQLYLQGVRLLNAVLSDWQSVGNLLKGGVTDSVCPLCHASHLAVSVCIWSSSQGKWNQHRRTEKPSCSCTTSQDTLKGRVQIKYAQKMLLGVRSHSRLECNHC